MSRLNFSTIAAISTPPGAGGIGVIRISGTDAREVAGRVFRSARNQPIAFNPDNSHRVFYGNVIDPHTGSTVDEALLTWMAAPHTYTTEDTVELSCHGGQLPVQETLRVVLAAGARLAEPGEFTLRAFLNGRLDLTQAEAVAEVVGARTAEGLQLAVEDLQGDLSQRISPARDAIVRLLAYLDAAADFPEDEIPGEDIDADLAAALEVLDAIIAGSKTGMLYREGAQVALVGRPNVGKSSLMNALLRSDRAIVTPIAGTTRDVITETCNIAGIPVTLLDTAGIAETAHVVERLGIERSERAISAAAAAVLVLDGSLKPGPEDLTVATMLASRLDSGAGGRLPVVVAVNKADLGPPVDQALVSALLSGVELVRLSSLTGEGIDHLEAALAKVLTATNASTIQPSLISARQRAALERTRTHLTEAEKTRAGHYPLDLMASDVRAGLQAIGEVTGENVSEAVLTEIFSRFCIGK